MKTKLISRITLMTLLLSAAAASGTVLAQGVQPMPGPGDARVNQVNQRLERQQERIQKGVAKGQINAKQEARDEKHVARIAQRERIDQARHGGRITKTEQHHLNRSLHKVSRHIHKQRHHARHRVHQHFVK